MLIEWSMVHNTLLAPGHNSSHTHTHTQTQTQNRQRPVIGDGGLWWQGVVVFREDDSGGGGLSEGDWPL